MKQLMKAAVIVLVFLATKSQAQTGWRMGLALNAGHATNDIYGLTLGADFRLQKNIGDKNFFILTSGVTHFFDTEKTIDGFSYVPLKAGIKSFLGKHFYITGEAGVGFGLNKGSDPSFLWAPSLGYSGRKVDVSIKYEDFNEQQYVKQVALRLAYGFKL